MGGNDPCACGSGKRFKHCRGAIASGTPSTSGTSSTSGAPSTTHVPSALHLGALELQWDACERSG